MATTIILPYFRARLLKLLFVREEEVKQIIINMYIYAEKLYKSVEWTNEWMNE
jgi:hypothetical protein